MYMMLDRLTLPSVAPIVDEAVSNNGGITSDFQIKLTIAEEFNLKALISIFVVYKDLKIYQTSSAVR